jgi:hypothetical protein
MPDRAVRIRLRRSRSNRPTASAKSGIADRPLKSLLGAHRKADDRAQMVDVQRFGQDSPAATTLSRMAIAGNRERSNGTGVVARRRGKPVFRRTSRSR